MGWGALFIYSLLVMDILAFINGTIASYLAYRQIDYAGVSLVAHSSLLLLVISLFIYSGNCMRFVGELAQMIWEPLSPKALKEKFIRLRSKVGPIFFFNTRLETNYQHLQNKWFFLTYWNRYKLYGEIKDSYFIYNLMNNMTFEGNMTGVTFKHTTLSNVTFERMPFGEVKFVNCTLNNVTLPYMARLLIIESSVLNNVIGTRFQRGEMRIRNSALYKANFSGAQIDQLTFEDVYFGGATDFSFFNVGKLDQNDVRIADDYKLNAVGSNISIEKDASH